MDVWLIAAVLQCLLTHARVSVEKGDGEYQHSPGSGDEEWEVQPGLPLHAQVPATGEGKTHHPRQQRSPSEVSWALFRTHPLLCCITYCVLLLCKTAKKLKVVSTKYLWMPRNPDNNNTQMAAIAPGPKTTHPVHWAEPTLHVHIPKKSRITKVFYFSYCATVDLDIVRCVCE